MLAQLLLLAGLIQQTSAYRILVATECVMNAWSPQTLRTTDVATTLASVGHEVILMSIDCSDAPDGKLEHAQVFYMGFDREHQPSADMFQSMGLDMVIATMWFATTAQNVVERIAPLLPQSARLVVLTDDAHARRGSLISHTIKSYPALAGRMQHLVDQQLLSDVETREASILALADMTLAVSDADAAYLTPLGNVVVLHWATSVLGPTVSLEQKPFGQRSGTIFVGHVSQPTNTLSLAWFFADVFGLLSEEIQKEGVTIVGVEPQDRQMVLDLLNGHLGKVTLLPHVPQRAMLGLLSSHKVLIAPSVATTGVTTKVLLALEAGIAVVATPASLAGLARPSVPLQALNAAVFVGNGAEGFAEAMTDAYTNETWWNDRVMHGLRVAERITNKALFGEELQGVVNVLTGFWRKATTSRRLLSAEQSVMHSGKIIHQKILNINPSPAAMGVPKPTLGSDLLCALQQAAQFVVSHGGAPAGTTTTTSATCSKTFSDGSSVLSQSKDIVAPLGLDYNENLNADPATIISLLSEASTSSDPVLMLEAALITALLNEQQATNDGPNVEAYIVAAKYLLTYVPVGTSVPNGPEIDYITCLTQQLEASSACFVGSDKQFSLSSCVPALPPGANCPGYKPPCASGGNCVAPNCNCKGQCYNLHAYTCINNGLDQTGVLFGYVNPIVNGY